jgi:glycosyltransferase involved in cell wall biosynthesis
VDAKSAAAGPKKELSVVMPVYNEGENIERVLRDLTASIDEQVEVMVVYDFDGDNTVPVVERLRAEFPNIRLHKNNVGRGVLNAIRSGFAAATTSYVLVMMADGSDEASAVEPMLQLAKGGADVVAGSRYVRGGGQIGGPRLKRTLSRLAGLSLHWVAGLPIHDATSNFRLYSRRLLDAVTIESSAGFELALELTVKAQRLGFRLAEVPTIWRDRTAGESRFRLWQWMPHYLRWYRYGFATRLSTRPRRDL